jgi:hypothetical protein
VNGNPLTFVDLVVWALDPVFWLPTRQQASTAYNTVTSFSAGMGE